PTTTGGQVVAGSNPVAPTSRLGFKTQCFRRLPHQNPSPKKARWIKAVPFCALLLFLPFGYFPPFPRPVPFCAFLQIGPSGFDPQFHRSCRTLPGRPPPSFSSYLRNSASPSAIWARAQYIGPPDRCSNPPWYYVQEHGLEACFGDLS